MKVCYSLVGKCPGLKDYFLLGKDVRVGGILWQPLESGSCDGDGSVTCHALSSLHSSCCCCGMCGFQLLWLDGSQHIGGRGTWGGAQDPDVYLEGGQISSSWGVHAVGGAATRVWETSPHHCSIGSLQQQLVQGGRVVATNTAALQKLAYFPSSQPCSAQGILCHCPDSPSRQQLLKQAGAAPNRRVPHLEAGPAPLQPLPAMHWSDEEPGASSLHLQRNQSGWLLHHCNPLPLINTLVLQRLMATAQLDGGP